VTGGLAPASRRRQLRHVVIAQRMHPPAEVDEQPDPPRIVHGGVAPLVRDDTAAGLEGITGANFSEKFAPCWGFSQGSEGGPRGVRYP
jgi:hypothetical protein